MGKKVCMLVCYTPAFDSRLYHREVKSLQKEGYQITMIVPKKDGYLLDIDGKPFTNQFLESTFIYDDIKFVTYDINKRDYILKKDPLFQLGLQEEADIYQANEFVSLRYGVAIKQALKNNLGKDSKLIYDSRELTPDPFSNTIDENKLTIYTNMLLNMLKEVDYTITVSDSIKAWYLTLNPLLSIEVIYNSPNLPDSYVPKEYRSNSLVACHEGNIFHNSGNIDKIYSITEKCNQSINFKFKVIGGGRHGESLPPATKDVIFKGWVHYTYLPNEMKDVDVGWIDLDVTNSLSYMFALPNKFFSYLSNGVPVLVNKCNDMEKIIRDYNCGLVIDKYEPTAEDYAQALIYLYNNKDILKQMSINARQVMENLYCWNKIEKRFLDVYNSLSSNNIRYFL